MFEVVFDYDEDHVTSKPPTPEGLDVVEATITPAKPWTTRRDPFSYRPGFESRTHRLCRRVLMFHHFPGELGVHRFLVRSTDFLYSDVKDPSDPRNAVISFLCEVSQSGYKRRGHSCVRRPCLAEHQAWSHVRRTALELMFDTAHDEGMGESGGRRGAERSLQGLRQSGLLARPAEGAAPDTPAERRPGARHCWLTDAPGLPGRWPGLVVEWRRHAGALAGPGTRGGPGGPGHTRHLRLVRADVLDTLVPG